ncbi:MAG: hypothetical protein Q7V62_09390, partial [Actinomycetota bacterium]|nr:hypothetical protein [Actinomycetota bacterium]
FNASWARGLTHGSHTGDGIVQQTNDRGVYHLAQKTGFWQDGDTCADTITFVQRLPSGATRDNTRLCSRHMFGITEWNRRMKHDARWRAQFGAREDAAAIKTEFGYIGVQQTRQDQLKATGTPLSEVNFIVSGRARVPNIWLACQSGAGNRKSVSELCVCYIVLTRHAYTSEAAATDAWTDTSSSRNAADWSVNVSSPFGRMAIDTEAPLRAAADKSAQEHAAALLPRALLRNALERMVLGLPAQTPKLVGREALRVDKVPVVGAPTKKKEYYWRADPWVSYDRSPPTPAIYCGNPHGDPNNQFVGDYWHIGQVIHLSKGPSNRTPQQLAWARAALYTDVRSAAYELPLRQLDEIELFLGCGKPGKLNV